MWHLSDRKYAMHASLYGQRSARKKNIDWWLNLLGLIPITLAAIVLSVVAMASITASFSLLAGGWYGFLAFIFVGALIGQGASSGNPFSQMMSAIFTDGLFRHLKLYVLKRELKKRHPQKIEALLKSHRNTIRDQLNRERQDNSAEEELDAYLNGLAQESDAAILHQLLMTYLNGKKDDKAKATQALFNTHLQQAITDILSEKAIKRELCVKKVLLITFGILVALTSVGYSTIIFTHIFGTLTAFSAASTAAPVILAGGAAGLVAVIFGFGLYFQFHQATKHNIFKHLFHVIKDIFDPRYIVTTAEEWNHRLPSPSPFKKKSLILGLSVFHAGKILGLLCVFGGLLLVTVLVSLFTAGASLNASVSTMNFVLLGLNLATPATLGIAQWLAIGNVAVILVTTTIFGYLSASEFISHAATLLRKSVAGELDLQQRLAQRFAEYKVCPWLALGDACIATLFTFVFTSYLAFELVKMAIPLEASRNPTTDAIPSYMAFSTFFSAVTQALNQLPHILGLENENGFVNRSVTGIRETFHHILANCRAQWEWWFGTQVFNNGRSKIRHSTVTLCHRLGVTPERPAKTQPPITKTRSQPSFFTHPLYEKSSPLVTPPRDPGGPRSLTSPLTPSPRHVIPGPRGPWA